MNGWRRQRFPGSDEFDRPSNESDLDEGEPRLLNGLERPLIDGQKGSCSGESTTFEFVVEHANLEVEFIDETKYPRVTAVPLQISTKVEDDWLTNTEKSRSIELVNAWDSYFRGENSWKRNRVTGDFIRCKPNHSSWGCEEFKVMGGTARGLKALMKVRESYEGRIPVESAPIDGAPTDQELQQMVGDPRYQTDVGYRQKVEKLFNQRYN